MGLLNSEIPFQPQPDVTIGELGPESWAMRGPLQWGPMPGGGLVQCGPMSKGAGGGFQGGKWVVGALYNEVQCIMSNGHMGQNDRQTDITENITFP